MKILIVGASGVLGRATLPHLVGHQVVGTTRTPDKRLRLAELCADARICDVYETGAIDRLARACKPDVVVNFLTDLSGGPGPANLRIRLEGGPLVTAAARASGATRLVVESIAFGAGSETAAAVSALEHNAAASGLDVLVLRFGRLWGPGTWANTAPEPPAIEITEAGKRAAALILDGFPGVHLVADGPAAVSRVAS